MSSMSKRSDTRKAKELKVLQLYNQGYSYRKIAKEVHLSLRDVSRYIHRISNKSKSPSTTSVMDEVVLEYRVNGLRREVKDLKMEKDKLKNELADLRAEIWNVHYKLCDKKSELESVKMNLYSQKLCNEVLKDIFSPKPSTSTERVSG